MIADENMANGFVKQQVYEQAHARVFEISYMGFSRRYWVHSKAESAPSWMPLAKKRLEKKMFTTSK
jgi:hypothetical protein